MSDNQSTRAVNALMKKILPGNFADNETAHIIKHNLRKRRKVWRNNDIHVMIAKNVFPYAVADDHEWAIGFLGGIITHNRRLTYRMKVQLMELYMHYATDPEAARDLIFRLVPSAARVKWVKSKGLLAEVYVDDKLFASELNVREAQVLAWQVIEQFETMRRVMAEAKEENQEGEA